MKKVREILENLSIPLFATILGLAVSSIFIVSAGVSPTETFSRLFCEGFGSRGCETFGDLFLIDVEDEDTGEVTTLFAPTYGERGHSLALALEQATPLILAALSATVAFKAGMFSIGMDGQLVLGALVAVVIGYALPAQIYLIAGVEDPDTVVGLPRVLMQVIVPTLAMTGAMVIGAFYSWIAGYLKVKLQVNELISTIVLNTIAVQFVGYMINFPLRADLNNIARTERIDDTAWLIPFSRGLFNDIEWFSGSRLGIGFIIATIAGILIWFFLWRTKAGYEQRMTEGAPKFAQFGGIPADRAIIRAMLISGALSGLAGAVQILGVERRIVDGFAAGATGFDGVLIAILAQQSIAAIFIVGVLFAGLQLGAINLQFGNIPRQLGSMIIAMIILFMSMEDYFRDILTRIQVRLKPVADKSKRES